MRTVLRTLVALCEDGRVGLRDLPADIRQALAALPTAEAAPPPTAWRTPSASPCWRRWTASAGI
ncbi:Sigma-54 dependent transcriptional regulator [Pseudomonas paraeruginosa]|nr:Sigma-54 dependent transcriptional regulator [Pseudomonas aeruginosa]